MILDRVLALCALVAMIGFLAIIVLRVGRVDLTIAIVLVMGMIVYDLWLQLRPRRR